MERRDAFADRIFDLVNSDIDAALEDARPRPGVAVFMNGAGAHGIAAPRSGLLRDFVSESGRDVESFGVLRSRHNPAHDLGADHQGRWNGIAELHEARERDCLSTEL